MDDLKCPLGTVLQVASLDSNLVIQNLLDNLSTAAVCTDMPVKAISPTLEALHQIMLFHQRRKDVACQKDCDASNKFQVLVSRCITEVLIPLVQNLNEMSTDNEETTQQILTLVCDVLTTSFKYADIKTQKYVWKVSLNSLSVNTENTAEYEGESISEIDSVIYILRCLLQPCINSSENFKTSMDTVTTVSPYQSTQEEIFERLLSVFHNYNEKVVSKMVSLVLVRFLKHEDEKLLERLENIWEVILKVFQESGVMPTSGVGNSSSISEIPYVTLCSLADFYFPVLTPIKDGIQQHFELWKNENFWNVIQTGLVQKNPLTRKRSLYLLKRIVDICGNQTYLSEQSSRVNSKEEKDGASAKLCPVFWWSPEVQSCLSKVWEDFILLAETLNEKQIHVVRPLFPRLDRLIEACSEEQVTGYPLLHTSWVITIVRRAVIHESVHVLIWGVTALLKIDPARVPLLTQGQDKYISSEFLYALKETRLYSRDLEVPVGSQPLIGQLMSTFLFSCWNQLDPGKRVMFYTNIINTIRGDNWGSLPLTYLTQGLASLPVGNVWDKDALLAIREIMSTSLTTMEQSTRAAIQCFLIESVVKLIDLEKTTPQDLAVVFAECCREESLKRGTTLWRKVASCLAHTFTNDKNPAAWSQSTIHRWTKSSVAQYLKTEDESVSGSALQLSRMMLLVLDALVSLDSTNQHSVLLGSCLSPVKDIISRIISHAYLSTDQCDRSLCLLVSLLEEADFGDGEVDPVMTSLLSTVSEYLDQIVTHLEKVKENLGKSQDFSRLNFYLRVLRILSTKQCLQLIGGHRLIEGVTDLVKWSVAVVDKLTPKDSSGENVPVPIKEGRQMAQVAAMSYLGSISEILSVIKSTVLLTDFLQYSAVQEIYRCFKDLSLQTGLAKPLERQDQEGSTTDSLVNQKAWGKIVSLYLSSQWTCLEFCLTLDLPAPPSLSSLDPCFETLIVGSGDTVPVIHCIHRLLPKYIESGDQTTAVRAIERVWYRLKEVRKVFVFWRELEAFVAMAYQPALVFQPPDSAVSLLLLKYAKELLLEGEERSRVVNVLISHLCAIFTRSTLLSAATHFSDIVAEACVFGNVLSRVDRTLYDTCSYIDGLKENCSVHELIPFVTNPDAQVRVETISCLTQLDPKQEEHCQFVTSVITSLINKHTEINRTQSDWNFANSFQHRLRQRLTQSVLILEVFIETEEQISMVWTYVWTMLAVETQPSVRIMLEWLALRLLVRQHSLLPRLWNLFQVSSLTEKRHMSLCSLLFIVSHLGPRLPLKLQETYYSQALLDIFPWCTVHHFNTRIHAQVTMKKLWNQCQRPNLKQFTDKYPIIQACLTFSKDESNSTKNAEKLEAHFIFSTFDFEEDYSAETIFETLPKLTAVSDDEWISPATFLRSNPTWSDGKSHYLPLYNSNDRLKGFRPGPWRLKGEDKYATCKEDDGQDGDVQKKILPWRFMKPDPEAEEQQEFRRMKTKTNGLILVTSLVEKIPNLGGLCRTSEIFGVSEFVIGNLQSLNDKAFQSLSVTAHKWLPVTEVKPFQVTDYLMSKRRQGYTLVGVEQTANSVCLTEYSFPQKTLLLLGNEKEGIPANLIQFLDTCVEIPQQGVIRSLNVHVSGALFVWEYTRQQILKSTVQN